MGFAFSYDVKTRLPVVNEAPVSCKEIYGIGKLSSAVKNKFHLWH